MIVRAVRGLPIIVVGFLKALPGVALRAAVGAPPRKGEAKGEGESQELHRADYAAKIDITRYFLNHGRGSSSASPLVWRNVGGKPTEGEELPEVLLALQAAVREGGA